MKVNHHSHLLMSFLKLHTNAASCHPSRLSLQRGMCPKGENQDGRAGGLTQWKKLRTKSTSGSRADRNDPCRWITWGARVHGKSLEDHVNTEVYNNQVF